MRKLSKINKKNSYAYCYICNEIFIDDIFLYGSISCPNHCYTTLRRGYIKDDLKELINIKTTTNKSYIKFKEEKNYGINTHKTRD